MNDFTLTAPNAVADSDSDANTTAPAPTPSSPPASTPATKPASQPSDQPPAQATPLRAIDNGSVVLDSEALRSLRHGRMLSQQDLADDCWRRNIRVSIATIKRAECGQAVRFRIVRELARCFDVPVDRLLRGA